MTKVTLITGGARSGKSRRALEAADAFERVAFVATARPLDVEMRARIERHRADRPAKFLTVEAPLEPAEALRALPQDVGLAVIDCLTLWLSNLMCERGPLCTDCPEIVALLDVLRSPPCDVVIVTNEVGMGIVPANEAARRFRDVAGKVNQRVAEIADEVILMVSGVPVSIKEKGNGR
ncbi:MAG: bifunctional adenosylcobinamide kinase/adenosylcobinamide-phosphate guanylyltransferase [Planctomycetes bacterium]|nr:bifunctional adenosylcobinamide kinase/adenosylcobinamide-phosphate guanylyltransferase [Planctomycetota bacterium]